MFFEATMLNLNKALARFVARLAIVNEGGAMMHDRAI
jgi:hypothetical protein